MAKKYWSPTASKYTQRQWDRTVGYGPVPDEYKWYKWFKENVIVLGSDDAASDVDKVKTALENEFGIDNPPVKKEN